MRILFFGTSSFAAKVLSYLLENKIDIAAVVTRPDRPRGRALQMSFSPVKETALKLNASIPLYQPEKVSTPEFEAALANYQADLFVVVAFGEIIKQNILSLPKMGCINIHASLLPKYRGAAPIQRCIMNGDPETGVTIIEMALKMDAGDIIEMAKIPLPPEMNFGELEEKLCDLACKTILKVIKDFNEGRIKKVPQDHSEATYAAKIMPEDEEINWQKPAKDLHNLIRALSPFPGAWSYVTLGEERKRLKIKRSRQVDRQGVPGEILSFNKEGWIVACGEGALQLLEVQLEGKKAMSAEDFIRGIRPDIHIKFI